MNEGKYILTQVTSYIPRQIFLRLVEKFKGDYRVRDFYCTNQLQYTLFGQLTPCESLRDICLCIGQNKDILYGLGIQTTVNESTLSRANDRRDYRIFEGLGQALIKIVQPLYAKTHIDYIVPQDHELYAFDSTTMSCSVKLMEWALGKYSKGGVKMHTLIDLRGSIPVFIHITDGRYHDSNAMDLLEIVPNAIYTMDKAYVDFEALARIDAEGGIFVLRAKDNMKYEIVSTNFNVDTSTGLFEDHIIRLTGVKSQKLYPKELRLVRSCTFITNMTDTLELNELEIASIYRHRWDIESFFKLIKQNLNIKHMLGCSGNATLVKVCALRKMDLKVLVTEPQPLIQNQDVNELN